MGIALVHLRLDAIRISIPFVPGNVERSSAGIDDDIQRGHFYHSRRETLSDAKRRSPVASHCKQAQCHSIAEEMLPAIVDIRLGK